LHGHVPGVLCQSTIIPLVKCKTGDLSDANNYRAIALSNSVSKILETLLTDFGESSDPSDEYQFGFMKNRSSIGTHIMFSKSLYITTDNVAWFTYFNKAFF